MKTYFYIITLISLITLSACSANRFSGGHASKPHVHRGYAPDETSEEVTITSAVGETHIGSDDLPINLPTATESETSTKSETTQVEIQHGTLTAGDYDDQLNYQLYLKYRNDFLKNTEQLKLPVIDIDKRIKLKIEDNTGNPVNNATIKIQAQGKTKITLTTPATGVVYIYPTYDKLPNSIEIVVSQEGKESQKTRTVELDKLNEDRSYIITIGTLASAPTQLDLAIVIDTTGSMGDELGYLKAELKSIVERISGVNLDIDIKVGLVAYRDKSDDYITREFDFRSPHLLLKKLKKQSYDGGGDTPEAMDQALVSANKLNWRKKSTKIMLLIADAPPHDNRIEATWASVKTARSKQIHIVPVAASGVDPNAEFLMRSMAAVTHSRYIFLTDDSGVGNPHAEPTVDCYVVSRLDNLITRVINSLIKGEYASLGTPTTSTCKSYSNLMV